MFKLLIVDDESYTREGIIEMIPWKELGIREIRQAFDGINALEVIKEYKPDIILSDIKMPRMNGIDLAINIRKNYSNCPIIFMSSYSDKIYLKSAIQLKAVNYIEKPLDLEELYNSIKDATLDILKLKSLKEDIENKLTIELTNKDSINKVFELLKTNYSNDYIEALNNKHFVNVIVKLFDKIVEDKNMIISTVKHIILSYNFQSFISFKDDNSLLIHLFKENIYLDFKENNNLNLLLLRLSEYINNFTKHYISVGTVENSIEKLQLSYINCQNVLSNSFHYDYNSIIFNNMQLTNDSKNKKINYKEFEDILKKEDKNLMFSYCQELHKSFKYSSNYSFSFIKDVYYNLTIRVINYSKAKNINLDSSYQSEALLNDILNFNNIYELKDFLWNTIDSFFNSISNKDIISEPIDKVIEFINNHYTDPNFSLDEVSKNTFLTSSYICVIFKDFMGITLNKYITELRVNKAKELLKNSDIKMKDIAIKTGYSDGNYFTKIFKKETGYNPSDYRRNFTK